MSDAVPVEFFSDLRHEVDLAARRYADVVDQRDRLMDEIAHIGFAVIPEGRTGEVHEDEILPLAKALRAERDRLRAVVDALREYRAVMQIRTANLADGGPDLRAESDLADRARALNRTIGEALDALDVSPAGEDT